MPENEPQNYWEKPEEQAETGTTPAADYGVSPTIGPVDDAFTGDTPLQPQDTPENPPVTWTAQEYVHLDRSPLWFVVFIVIVLGLISVDVFLLKSWTFSVLVVVMAVALVIYIRRPPRSLTYALSPTQGLYVGEKLYVFDEFKSFGLIRDGESFSIMLIPRKRFAPGVSVYFPEETGERIVDILGKQLPMENLKLDVVDIIVRKLRL